MNSLTKSKLKDKTTETDFLMTLHQVDTGRCTAIDMNILLYLEM